LLLIGRRHVRSNNVDAQLPSAGERQAAPSVADAPARPAQRNCRTASGARAFAYRVCSKWRCRPART
jgi:hypothetical protein